MTMYPPWTQTTSPKSYPRPLEPDCRPPLRSTLSEKAGMLTLKDGHRYQDFPPPQDNRTNNRNLPALRDILRTEPYSPTQASYGNSWATNGYNPVHEPAPHLTYHSRDKVHPPMVYNHDPVHPPMIWTAEGVHPPMVLQPLNPTSHMGHPPMQNGYERPGADDLRPPPLRPSSPKGAHVPFGLGGRDVPVRGHSTSLSGSYMANGLSNVNGIVPREEAQPRVHGGVYRPARISHPQTSSESHGEYLGIDTVPGEGVFHVYEDGHRLPTQVDGEAVNPAWGLTKANKPRKRLAMACLDCREKKIKCEPGRNSCIQCEKAMRPCRKATEKNSHTDASTTLFGAIRSPPRNEGSVSDSSHRGSESDPANKRRDRADPSPPLEPSKKHREIASRCNDKEIGDCRRRQDSITHAAEANMVHGPCTGPMSLEDDPFAVEPEMTLRLLDLYFTHLHNAFYAIFPRRHFLDWLKTTPEKCLNERTTLYSMLSAASIFATDELALFGMDCVRIAVDAVTSQTGRFNVATANSRILLAFYHLAKGANAYAWDYAGSAIRIVTSMNLNTEEGCLDDKDSRANSRFEFYLSPAQLAECKRRTFWSAFLCDRLCGATVCMLKPEDVFVRLPCTDDMFEDSVPSDAPYFANGILDPSIARPLSSGGIASTAWLLPVAAAWGDVSDFVFRASRRSAPSYRTVYELFYGGIQTRLQEWVAQLPAHLQFNPTNLDRSIHEGYTATFILMHVLYHFTLLKLNRYMRHRLLPDSVLRNIRAANHHGHAILQLVNTPRETQMEDCAPSPAQQMFYACSPPFIGYAVLSAIDVVSAGGLDSHLGATLDEIHAALGYLRELEQFWNPAVDQLKLCSKRYYQLKNVTISPKNAFSGCWLGRKWGIRAPMEQEGEPQDDCIYGLGERDADEAEQRYYDAFVDR